MTAEVNFIQVVEKLSDDFTIEEVMRRLVFLKCR
jgi:hypothetical protein